MKKIRIGKNIGIRWKVTTNGEDTPLSAERLTLVLNNGMTAPVELAYEIVDGNVVYAVFRGTEQRYIGEYSLTLWQDRGTDNQTVVDACSAFALVACTCEEDGEDSDNLATDEEVELSGELTVGADINSTLKEIKEAETERAKAETLRNDAEAERVKNERERGTAETLRQESETARQTAEQQRQTDFRQMQTTFSKMESTISGLQKQIDELNSLNFLIVKNNGI